MPTIANNKVVSIGGNLGPYTAEITGLPPATRIYIRAYATNLSGTGYGNELSFTTESFSLPFVQTTSVFNITRTSAEASGAILDDGGTTILIRGLCWSKSPNPTRDGLNISLGAGVGNFQGTIKELSPGTTYYMRSFAANLQGTGYSNEIVFKTDSVTLPTVLTVAVLDITPTGAIAYGTTEEDGGNPILKKGFCWGLTSTPTLSDSKVDLGPGKGDFETTLSGLNPGTRYFLRSYATNALGTGYGNEIAFNTDSVSLPTVLTISIDEITYTGAKVYASAKDDGGYPILSKGFCWGLNTNPAISGSKVELGPGKGDFETTLSGLNPGTRYFLRSYATNKLGTGYGNEMVFTTDSVTLPTVLTLSMTDLSLKSAKGHGRVADDGGSTILNKGFCWGTDPGPTIAGAKVEVGPEGGDFEGLITELAPGTFYYLRSFATNANGTAYGNEINFSTGNISLPSVSTLSISKVGADSAIANGRIYSDGGDSITNRGFCWGTGPNPTVNGNKLELGKGVGNFSGTIKGLSSGTPYYLRSYASNSAGTAYGNEITFTTVNITNPVIGPLLMSGVGSSRAWGNSAITSDGGAAVTSRGICYSQSPNPTVDGSKILLGSGTGNFGGAIKGLIPGRKYYLKSFAVNTKGISYSAEISVTTPALLSDIDGNVYNTTTIGNQTWMAENLRTTRYNNGDNILHLPNNGDWKNSTSGAWSYYQNNETYNIPYGKMYNWPAAVDSRNVCPQGWHVSTSPDWHTMFLSLGAKEPFIYYRDILAPKIRIEGTEYWGVINKDATNESGLSGLPGGWRNTDGSYDFLLNRTWFWTATEYNITSSYAIDLQPEHLIGEGPMSKIFGLYVRWVKN
ncbi:MAG: fibrobacter succinogenes major paralogous domain-containing protein [Haliscomenobacter sp.]|nr:fibrobacter succinogenes major paralogous domain-containing protein [Haliscomenobacter sp.]